MPLPCGALVDLTFNVPGVGERRLRGLVVHRTGRDAGVMFVDDSGVAPGTD